MSLVRFRSEAPLCGRSSSGRAPPCQGGGSEFEPRKPLHFFASVAQLVEQGTENPRVIGSIPIGGTSSSQATYRLRRFFYKKSSRAHSAAPRFPTKFCFANFRGDPGRPKGGHKRHIACGDFFAKSRRRAHSAAAPSPHEILLRKLPRGPRRPGGHERHIACGDFFAKSRQAPAEIGTKGARCRSFLALHPL